MNAEDKMRELNDSVRKLLYRDRPLRWKSLHMLVMDIQNPDRREEAQLRAQRWFGVSSVGEVRALQDAMIAEDVQARLDAIYPEDKWRELLEQNRAIRRWYLQTLVKELRDPGKRDVALQSAQRWFGVTSEEELRFMLDVVTIVDKRGAQLDKNRAYRRHALQFLVNALQVPGRRELALSTAQRWFDATSAEEVQARLDDVEGEEVQLLLDAVNTAGISRELLDEDWTHRRWPLEILVKALQMPSKRDEALQLAQRWFGATSVEEVLALLDHVNAEEVQALLAAMNADNKLRALMDKNRALRRLPLQFLVKALQVPGQREDALRTAQRWFGVTTAEEVPALLDAVKSESAEALHSSLRASDGKWQEITAKEGSLIREFLQNLVQALEVSGQQESVMRMARHWFLTSVKEAPARLDAMPKP